jgi:flagellar biogenesis protein FliO
MIAFAATLGAMLALVGLAAWTLRRREGCACCRPDRTP